MTSDGKLNVATVLTVYGIETLYLIPLHISSIIHVATVLTVYGIETLSLNIRSKK